jgi:formiminotetrahydrofolate cyclodeaminase
VENFDSSLILENRLAAVTGGKMAVGGLRAGIEPFIEQLAAPTATPGGGSAAAASGAMAAGLATMVATMSRGKKAYLQYENELSAAIARLAPLREELKAAIDADAEAYNAVMKAFKAARENPDNQAAVAAATRQATSVPLRVAEAATEIAGIAESLIPITNPNMKSDLTTALALSAAAREGALANVAINLDSLKPETAEDQAFVVHVRERLERIRKN